jgi:penicillin-binding protein 1C
MKPRQPRFRLPGKNGPGTPSLLTVTDRPAARPPFGASVTHSASVTLDALPLAAAAPPFAALPAPAKRWWRRWCLSLLGGVLLSYYALPWAMPLPPALTAYPPALAVGDISPWLIQATLSAEDQRFWTHGGIDFLGIVRAVGDSAEARRAVSGASTITQQLIKVARGRYRGRTWRDKAVECLAARRLEMTWSKERILCAYLSRIEYGNQFTGAATAARGYFHTELRSLTLPQAALLAGLPQAPGRLNPLKNYPAAKKRQLWILGRMVDDGALTPTEAATAGRVRLRVH